MTSRAGIYLWKDEEFALFLHYLNTNGGTMKKKTIDPRLFYHRAADHICAGMGRLLYMASSPAGDEIASAGPGFIFFWTRNSARPVRYIATGQGNGISCLSYSPDGLLIASSSWDGTVKVWENGSGALVKTIDLGDDEAVACCAFSPDGRYLAAGSDSMVTVWERSNDWHAYSYKGLSGYDEFCYPRGYAESLSFSPDGSLLVAAFNDEIVYVIDMQERKLSYSFQGRNDIEYTAFSPDGNELACGGRGWEVSLWDMKKREWSYSFETRGGLFAVTYSGDGRFLAASAHRKLYVWERNTRTLYHTFKGQELPVVSLSFMAGGNGVVTASGDLYTDGDNKIKTWDLEKMKLVKTFTGHSARLFGVAVSPDSLVAAYGGDKKVILWDCEKHSPFQAFTYRCMDEIEALRFSGDGKRLVWATFHGALEVMDVETGDVLLIARLEESINCLSLSPDGRYLATGSGDTEAEESNDNLVRLWDFLQKSLLLKYKGHRKEVTGVAFSPDGKLIASCSLDGTVKLWNRDNRKCARTLLNYHEGGKKKYRAGLLAVCFSPDGQSVIAADWDGRVIEWVIEGSGEPSAIKGHQTEIRALDISPCGKFLASGSMDSTIKLWDRSNRELIHTFSGHGATVQDLAFSPDGRFIASVSFDGTMRVWFLEEVLSRVRQSPPQPGECARC
jgi:WD40 repeat protein